MITLKEALALNSDEIKKLQADLLVKINESNIGSYIEQLDKTELSRTGAGIPIAIKNNINVKNWEITSASNILKGYISPYNATVIDKLEKAGLSAFGKAFIAGVLK